MEPEPGPVWPVSGPGSWLDPAVPSLLCPAPRPLPPVSHPSRSWASQATGLGRAGPCGSQRGVRSEALAPAGTLGGLARVLRWPWLTPKPRPAAQLCRAQAGPEAQGQLPGMSPSWTGWREKPAGLRPRRYPFIYSRRQAHPGQARPQVTRGPGRTNLCDSHQRSLSPETPASGRDGFEGECSVWQI